MSGHTKGQTNKRPAIPEVDTQNCPESAGTHHLENTRAGTTRCRFCREGWDVLDERLRDAL